MGAPVFSEMPGPPRCYAAGMELFLNALLLDGLGGYRERSALLVNGGRIAEVGPQLAERRRDGITVIDLQGRTLLPGMIDTHCHPGGGDYDPAH